MPFVCSSLSETPQRPHRTRPIGRTPLPTSLDLRPIDGYSKHPTALSTRPFAISTSSSTLSNSPAMFLITILDLACLLVSILGACFSSSWNRLDEPAWFWSAFACRSRLSSCSTSCSRRSSSCSRRACSSCWVCASCSRRRRSCSSFLTCFSRFFWC